MNLDNDYDNDGNNIVPCPICLNVYCPSKEGGKCPDEDEFAKAYPANPQTDVTNPTNKSEGAEKDPIIGIDIAEGSDKTVYVRGHRDEDGVLHITEVSEGAEWEADYDALFGREHNGVWLSLGGAIHKQQKDVIRAFIATLLQEQRQQAYKQGYVDGFLATGEGYNGEYMPGAKDRHNVTAEDILATL